MKKLFVSVLSLMLVSLSVTAQDKVTQKVLEMGRTDNRTMQHADYLANRIGGRLIGSYSLQQAEQWVKDQFEAWGLEVMVQEVGEINVGFNRGPWFGRMLSEDGMDLHFCTPSYTAGTRGPQIGHVVLEPRTRAEFERCKGRLKGAWVLLETPSSGNAVVNSAKADSTRARAIKSDEQKRLENAGIEKYNREHPESPKPLKKLSTANALFYNEMVEAGVLGFIQSAKLPIVCQYNSICYSLTMETLPSVCDIKLDENQFEIIRKKVLGRKEVLLEFDIRNHFSKGPIKYHNIIGIIKGSKYPDQTVILGGHLDAFDGATGAVDDGNGVSVAMEAARLLAAAGARPKRTMLFCIWAGEEFGLLGSKHFVESGAYDISKVSNYFNRDGGPTLATSITVPPAMYDDFVKVAKPVENYVEGAPFKVIKREGEAQPRPKSGSSDHYSFIKHGAPGISLTVTDPFGYDFQYRDIWHTDCDLWNKLIPEYMEPSSVISAVIAYGIANLDHQLSRDGLYAD